MPDITQESKRFCEILLLCDLTENHFHRTPSDNPKLWQESMYFLRVWEKYAVHKTIYSLMNLPYTLMVIGISQNEYALEFSVDVQKYL